MVLCVPSLRTMVDPAGSFTGRLGGSGEVNAPQSQSLGGIIPEGLRRAGLVLIEQRYGLSALPTVKSAVSVAGVAANTDSGTSDNAKHNASRIAVSFDLCILFSIFSHSFLIFWLHRYRL